MKNFTSILMSVAAGLLVLSACAPAVITPTAVVATPEPPTAAPALTPTGPAESTPEPQATAPAEGPQTVTLDDQGKTVRLAVGESFLLKLGEAYQWDIALSDPNVVSRVKNIAVVRGAQGVYTADHAGTVTLSATGDPLCRQSTPACAMPSLMFTVTLVVA